MKVKNLIEFLNQYDNNTKVSFGIIDGETGEWYEFKVNLLDIEKMGDESVGIEFRENKKYNQAKSESAIDDLKEDIIAIVDRY